MNPSQHAARSLPQVLELFGPSSGGKSSLAARLLAGEAGPGFVLATDRVLAGVGLGWLPGQALRTLAIDAIAALTVAFSWRALRPYYARAAAQALRGDGPSSWRVRLNLLRNAWKAGAVGVLAGRLARPGKVLILDEGPLQAANYLFVHVDPAPEPAALDAFLAAVPLPDAVLYVREAADELVARTLARTHPRVPAGGREETARFVAHALEVFDRAAAEPRVSERLLRRDALFGRPCPRREAHA